MANAKTSSSLDSPDLLQTLLSLKSTAAVEELLGHLPVVDETAYLWVDTDPAKGWQVGKLHWIPVGRDRGNAGRIQLAGNPYNPPAERLINGMEAIIELLRRMELLRPMTREETPNRAAIWADPRTRSSPPAASRMRPPAMVNEVSIF